MLTDFQQLMLNDFTGPQGYGRLLAAWQGQREVLLRPNEPAPALGPLEQRLANTFVDQFHMLLTTSRTIKLYRGFETAHLQAPFGKDHPSVVFGLVAKRNPSDRDGRWWTPHRPAASIDHLGLSDMHRNEDRDNSAIALEWNRLDYYVAGDLPVGSRVYVGRAASQQEKAVYGGQHYSGGAIQFRLPLDPQVMLRNLEVYTAE